MNLKELECLAKYKVLLKPGTKVTIGKEKGYLDRSDCLGNSPYIGFLWVRKENVPSSSGVLAVEEGVFISELESPDNSQEVLGVVSIFTGMFISLEEYNKASIPNIPDLSAIVKLYHENFPKEPSFFQKVMLVLKNIFGRKR